MYTIEEEIEVKPKSCLCDNENIKVASTKADKFTKRKIYCTECGLNLESCLPIDQVVEKWDWLMSKAS